MIYAICDRKLLKAETFKEMVMHIRNISFDSSRNKKEFMFNVAKRVENLYDKYIESYHYKEFIFALDKLTIIHIIRCSDCDYFCLNITSDEYFCSLCIKSNFHRKKWDCPFMFNKYTRKLKKA